ncbi:TolC family protein [Mucilaginibacter sp.]|uniref:TolC family protein n=1 Tax=Mucilaginibacter sp. TaxID=1882438 RepID=UPI000CA65052|nr:TolC family protein [Mucilaginibacter sp.]PLW89218.1 MAG: TolC family protein [Mucilaginibacter sp.]HEK19963.1 TolC family protein [Bacteroidota bacterium]
MKKYILALIITFSGLRAIAQQHVISLEASKEAALSYSNTLKNGQLRIESAKAGVTAAKSDYLPSVSATGVGLLGFKDFVSAMPPLLSKGINNFYLLGVTGMQPLYTGGKIKTGNELAALQLEVTRIRMQQSTDSVLLLTEQKYWNLVSLQEQQKTVAANEVLLNGLLKMQKDMLASGLIARNDLLKVKVQLSQLMVQKSKLQNGNRVALLDFSMYTGIPFDSLMTMRDTLDKQHLPTLPGLSPDTLLARNLDYQLLRKRIDAQALQTRLAKGDNLPSISVGVSASQAGSFNNGLGSSFVPVGLVTVSIPISSGLWGRGKQKVRQEKLNEAIAANDLHDAQNQIRLGITRYWYELKDQLTQIRYAQENVKLADENLKVNRDNYKAGLAPVTDVLDAQASYQQAVGVLTTAYTDYNDRLAVYRYMTASGDNHQK